MSQTAVRQKKHARQPEKPRAKNHRHVLPLCDPDLYDELTNHLDRGEIGDDFRLRCAIRVFEKTAQYEADQFKSFGLKPAGDGGGWFQRYPLPSGDGTAPNVVGILEGGDPKLKNEYVASAVTYDRLQ